MSSFQGVGVEGFHCIQRCPHFRVLEWRSSTVYRGVLISGCWNRGVPLYTEVSSFQGIGIEGFHHIQRCPHLGSWNRGVPEVSSFEGVGIEGFHTYTEVSLI